MAEIEELKEQYKFTSDHDLLIVLIAKNEEHGSHLKALNGTVATTCDRVSLLELASEPEDHKRIDRLESWRNWMAGGMTLFMTIVFPATAVFVKTMWDHLTEKP